MPQSPPPPRPQAPTDTPQQCHSRRPRATNTTATTTKIFNDLTSDAARSCELTQVQHYNDLARATKTTNMESSTKALDKDAKTRQREGARDKNTNVNGGRGGGGAGGAGGVGGGGGAVEKTAKKDTKRGLSLSLKRSKFWTSLHNKTLELPERLRRDERKLARVSPEAAST